MSNILTELTDHQNPSLMTIPSYKFLLLFSCVFKGSFLKETKDSVTMQNFAKTIKMKEAVKPMIAYFIGVNKIFARGF